MIFQMQADGHHHVPELPEQRSGRFPGQVRPRSVSRWVVHHNLLTYPSLILDVLKMSKEGFTKL